MNGSFPQSSPAASGRLHSMASGSFRDAKLERPVSGAELRRLLVASRPVAVIGRIDRPTAGIGVELPFAPTDLQQRNAFRSTPDASPESVPRPLATTSPSNSGVDGVSMGVIALGSGEGFQAAWGID